MNKLLFLIISLCLIKIIVGQCYLDSPSSVEECENEGKGDNTFRCCYIEYRTKSNSTYKTICIGINRTEIKSGHHEETIRNIEKGTYNGSNWIEENLTQFFNETCSIDIFDCKGNYISKSFLLFSSLLLFLI